MPMANQSSYRYRYVLAQDLQPGQRLVNGYSGDIDTCVPKYIDHIDDVCFRNDQKVFLRCNDDTATYVVMMQDKLLIQEEISDATA